MFEFQIVNQVFTGLIQNVDSTFAYSSIQKQNKLKISYIAYKWTNNSNAKTNNEQ